MSSAARTPRFFFVMLARSNTVAKFVKYYNVKGPERGQSLIHLFTFSLIVARDRAPDLLEQGRRLSHGLRPDSGGDSFSFVAR